MNVTSNVQIKIENHIGNVAIKWKILLPFLDYSLFLFYQKNVLIFFKLEMYASKISAWICLDNGDEWNEV